MGLLTGKTALVTGAARGIGKAIALKFAAEGANGQATEAEIAAFGVKAKGYASNAADFAQTEEVVKQVKEDFGSIDILVNNAGITKDGLMLRMTEAQWDAVIAVNLKSAFNFIHACTPIMMRQKGGSIINMASVGNGARRFLCVVAARRKTWPTWHFSWLPTCLLTCRDRLSRLTVA